MLFCAGRLSGLGATEDSRLALGPLQTDPPGGKTADEPFTLAAAEVKEAYLFVLGREPDAAGLAHYTRSGLTRGQLLRALLKSSEFLARPDDVRRRVIREKERLVTTADDILWFHSIELPDGTITKGAPERSLERLRLEADLVFVHPPAGKSVLDIGAWDGFFSFEAERRGAADVLATDWFSWSGPGWGTKEGYDYAHRALSSGCRSEQVAVENLDPALHGTFDLVLFLGVFYHLKAPLIGLERAAAMCRGELVIETLTANDDLDVPLLQHAPSYRGDPSNHWIPNVACVKSMLDSVGFTRFLTQATPPLAGTTRTVIHAWRG
jgi:tRNA (mo5U34)-methyltransferase